MAFGYHLLIDLYHCKGNAVTSLEECYQFLEDLCELLKMNKQSPPFIFRSDDNNFPDNAGFSGWLPLIESGIQIHTIESLKFVSLDVYSCKVFDQDRIIQYVKEIFIPSEIEYEFILRGKKYNLSLDS